MGKAIVDSARNSGMGAGSPAGRPGPAGSAGQITDWRLLAKAAAASTASVVFALAFAAWYLSSATRLSAESPTDAYGRVAWDALDTIAIKAIGRESGWVFQYAGGDGQLDSADDFTSDRWIHVQQGKTVDLHITSEDYVYIFSVPQLDQKQIAVPDMIHRLTFDPPPEGTFDMVIDPMCGLELYHENPVGRLVVRPRDSIMEWIRSR